MPGMNSGLDPNDPLVVAAFKTALAHQGLIALLIFAVLGAAWACLRARQRRRATSAAAAPGGPAAAPEPRGRLVLAIGFGNLWLFDGILQAQPQMPVGLPSQGLEPAAASSPVWVQHLVNWSGTSWSYHPVQMAAAAVWIQVGIGLWLLVAPRGTLSRLAGLASVGWGLVVWVFGESLGGILAPGLSWLTGAPGSALLYVVAGALLALPERAWRSPRPGQFLLGGLGLFLIGMAVLQAWPGRGFWQGLSPHGQMGTLPAMTYAMSATPQPAVLSGWVLNFTSFEDAHGFGVNLFYVLALAVIGAVFLSALLPGRRPRLIQAAVLGFGAVCLATWVLVQDIGFLGGTGTDPNSMIPFILLAAAGYLALTRVPVQQPEAVPAASPAASAAAGPAAGQERVRLRLAALARTAAGAGSRPVLALGAAGVLLLGVVPMAVAQVSPDADPILAESLIHASALVDSPAPQFTLTDQDGRTVTLASLRGKVVLLSFCASRCAAIGAELNQAGQLLGGNAGGTVLASVMLSPARPAGSARPDGLSLTAPAAQLQRVARQYRAAAGPATAHGDALYVINETGYIRQAYDTDPGPSSTAVRSSFAVLFARAAQQALPQRA
jgi:cytochrome oxidase Cu insertion factor (SCO1/SenC/PrrC family)